MSVSNLEQLTTGYVIQLHKTKITYFPTYLDIYEGFVGKAEVTFMITQGHWNGAIRYSTYDFIFVFHCKDVCVGLIAAIAAWRE